ncbi:MAG: L,D-transpeptidase family protein [Bacteroidales bacterium]|nr:L,D-transpeptidase family protein [Bacteroidales bacterium]
MMKRLLNISKKRKNLITFLFFFVFPFIGSGYHYAINDLKENETDNTRNYTRQQILNELEEEHPSLYSSSYKALIADLYSKNNFSPLWTKGFSPNNSAHQLMDIAEKAANYGLTATSFNVEKIQRLFEKMAGAKNIDRLTKLRLQCEFLMSESAIKVLIQLKKGVHYSDTVNLQNGQNHFLNAVPSLINVALHTTNFKYEFLSNQPYRVDYALLQKGLERFLTNVQINDHRVEFTGIKNDSAMLRETVAAILKAYGFLKSATVADSTYLHAIKGFQRLHNLDDNGELDNKTLRALERSTLDHYKQAAVAMERMRREEIESDMYLLVNIPGFKLNIVENNKLQDVYLVQVGRPESPTPVLTSQLMHIVTNPKWYVPKSISTKEMLHSIRKDSTYLKSRNFKLLAKNNLKEIDYKSVNWESVHESNFNYVIQQDPGNGNALGNVKFLFPNQYSVYLHDTPSKSHFNKKYRAYSHGCIRLHNPEKLADYLINKTGYAQLASVKGPINRKETKTIEISKPVDVFLRYYTCIGDENGDLTFYEDIYGLDHVIEKEIFN